MPPLIPETLGKLTRYGQGSMAAPKLLASNIGRICDRSEGRTQLVLEIRCETNDGFDLVQCTRAAQILPVSSTPPRFPIRPCTFSQGCAQFFFLSTAIEIMKRKRLRVYQVLGKVRDWTGLPCAQELWSLNSFSHFYLTSSKFLVRRKRKILNIFGPAWEQGSTWLFLQ